MQTGTSNKGCGNPNIAKVLPLMEAGSRGYWEKSQETRLLDRLGLSIEDTLCHDKEVGFHPVVSGL